MPNPPPGYEWDEWKAAYNLKKHGVSFAAVKDFDFATAFETEDLREDYGETRIFSLGKIGRRLHALVYTRRAKAIRVISLRKARADEKENYLATGRS
ncbi:MAG: BrnT family toxin [Terricaulis sp.]